MSQHFLLSAAARTVSLKQILRMEEAEAWTMFCSIRWPETDGAPVCPHCGCPTCWSSQSATWGRLNPPPWGRNNAEVVIMLIR